MNNSIFSMISLCQKAGKLLSGEFKCEQAIKNGKAKMVIIAEDASANTKKLFKDKCNYRNIPIYEFGSKEKLGKIIGKRQRASLVVLDENFYVKLKELLEKEKM
ncbi:L7Ae/L30e/S12e/Gadd45 family ribosomal protein [Defluviitalea phaphyphila]|uniref:L7Ae/L30e/S12e/Gadd45 family ribosomal protein n=1 Tax=Defluviitalea phaphyphila TaxID=1473580 RepID=UPI000730746A|nr:ribosomal L7Ae/L30e/S12e/Gadd45 family protein [Defluviitalea phaphyphila]